MPVLSFLRRPAVLLLAGALTVPAGLVAVTAPAAAEPKPTLEQVRRQVDVLNRQAEHAGEAYNNSKVELQQTTRRLEAVRHRYQRQQQAVEEMRTVVGRIAATAYKNGSMDSSVALVLSEDPTEFLRQAADLTQLGRRQSAMLRDMASARLLLAQDRKAVRAERGRAAALKKDLAEQKASVERKLASARRLVANLEAEQRAQLAAERRRAAIQAVGERRVSRSLVRGGDDSGGAAGSVPTYDGPASGRAAEAVQTAYAQLGDPYVWGGTGPNAFDCSGLTMYSWGAAGVSLPHSSSAQYSAVRHVSLSDLQPGDLVFYYSPISHVAIYIGGGQVIDAPYPGKSVHITGLHSMPVVGAGRP
jgi:peptidoglycan DL-endopeptidase CwlO